MKLLVVVDYQNDFVNGALGFENADKIDAGIATKIREKDYDALVVTYDTHKENYLKTREGRALPVEHCIYGTEGHDLFGETKTAVYETDKPCFKILKETFATSPADMVNLMIDINKTFGEGVNVDTVEFTGLVTNMCVLSNVVCFQGAYPQAQMVVDASLVDSFNKELHEKTLDILEGMQVQVINR